MEAFFDRYGVVALFLYVILKDGLPFAGKALLRWIPVRAKEKELAAKALMVKEERGEELRERNTVALEVIGQNLTIQNERLSAVEKGQTTMLAAVITSNQGIAILLDRESRVMQKDATRHS